MTVCPLFFDAHPPTKIFFARDQNATPASHPLQPKTNAKQKPTMDSPDERKQQLAQVKKRPSLSKRQRRAAGPNPSNTWQQQPRIKSAGARARAYISYAGLDDDGGGDDNKRRRGETTHSATSPGGGGVVEGGKPPSSSSSSSSRPPASSSSSLRDSLDPHLDLDSPEVKFGRLLGGTDQRSRHAAVKLLRAYLRGRTDFANGGVGLSELDLLKLWKVSYGCFSRTRVFGRCPESQYPLRATLLRKNNRDCGTHSTWPTRPQSRTSSPRSLRS